MSRTKAKGLVDEACEVCMEAFAQTRQESRGREG